MFPISSTTLTAPQFPVVTPTSETAPVNSATVSAIGSATDALPAASVTVDLSPVASFLLTVSQSQQQLTQLQTAIANGGDPQEAAARAATLNEATQNVVNAFNLLPAVDFDQAQPQGTSLLNNLVQSLTQQTEAGSATGQQSAQQNLAQIGLTLQPPLLSDATGGLSLDNEILRAAFNSDDQGTTSTLQNTLDTFSRLATQFAEQLSAAGSGQLPALGSAQPQALTPAEAAANLAANARLDLARAEIEVLRQVPLPDTGADRLATQRAALEQNNSAQAITTPSPIVNPLQASTADVIAAQNAEARQAGNAVQAANDFNNTGNTNNINDINDINNPQATATNQVQAQNAAAGETQDADAANEGSDDSTGNTSTQATADAARATAQAQAAQQQSSLGLNAATSAGAQAAAQATIAQNAAATAAANNPANAGEGAASQCGPNGRFECGRRQRRRRRRRNPGASSAQCRQCPGGSKRGHSGRHRPGPCGIGHCRNAGSSRCGGSAGGAANRRRTSYGGQSGRRQRRRDSRSAAGDCRAKRSRAGSRTPAQSIEYQSRAGRRHRRLQHQRHCRPRRQCPERPNRHPSHPACERRQRSRQDGSHRQHAVTL
jgi:hypothetical protein